MAIKIDPETQKAVDPESIGKDTPKRLVIAVLLIAVAAIVMKLVL